MKSLKKYLYLTIILLLLILTIIKAVTINGHDLKVREETIISNKLAKGNELLICYFCDLNYGTNLTEQDLNNIANTIDDFHPDLILFGGDLIHSQSDTTLLNNFLNQLNAKYGKYACLGDEDLTNEQTINLLEQNGFIILNNENRKLYCDGLFINLIGITPTTDLTNINLYEGINKDHFTLVLSHYPDLFNEVDKTKTDYVISGHSLGGPIYLPLLNYLYRDNGATNYYQGKYKVDDLILDISSGLGTKGNDIRLFSNEEIVFYKLSRAN